MRVFTKIFLVLICSHAFSQTQQKTDSLEIWTLFTIGDFVNDNAYKIASENWPFKYVSVAGDIFTEEFADSINNHNEKLWEALIKKGYSNPEENFYEQYKSERNRIESAEKIVINDSIFKQLDRRLIAENRMNYTRLRKESDTVYVFEIFSFDLKDQSSGDRFEMRLIVDLNMKKLMKE
jgi:hypothetical protein